MAARIEWRQAPWLLGLVAASILIGALAGYSPSLAIGITLACAFALILFSDLALGLSIFAFASFLELVPFGLTDALARLAVAIAWVAVLTTQGRRELEFFGVFPITAAVLGLFLGWALLSAVWAEKPSMATLSAERYALDGLLILIVFTACRKRDDIGKLVLALLFGAIAAAIYGLVTPSDPLDPNRLESSILDPNLLAASLVSGVALSVAVVAIYRSPLIRLLGVLGGAFCVAGTFLTASRGGLIALAVCLVAGIVFGGRWRGRLLVGGIVLAVAAYGYFAYFAPAEIRQRISEPTRGEAQERQGRLTLWQVAIRAFDANPVQGIGAGNFRVSGRRYLFQPGALPRTDQVIEDPKVVHNVYLEILAELGAVGFALFVFVVVACLSSFFRAARRFAAAGDQAMQAAATSAAVALLGVLAADIFVSDQYSKLLWLLLGLGPAMLTIARSDAKPAAEARDQRGTRLSARAA